MAGPTARDEIAPALISGEILNQIAAKLLAEPPDTKSLAFSDAVSQRRSVR